MKINTPGALIKAAAVLFILINVAVISILLLSSAGGMHVPSFLAGSLLSLANFTAGFLIIRFTIDKSIQIFMMGIFGGMFLRLMAMLGMVIICLKFLELNPISFIFSILFFYIFFIIIEIIYLNFRKNR